MIELLLRLVMALFTILFAGATGSLTLSEAQVNDLLTSQVEHTYIDLIPNAFYLSTQVTIGGRRLSVGATAPAWVQDGALRVYVSQTWIGSRPAPEAAARILNESVIPRINAMIGDMSPDCVVITDVAITDTSLTVYFTLQP
ncbi:MAG: hypothetical protein JXB47_01310 [Anaerolineae bacterium]|nr:hypothetical protein [Anaerolineae bacterium]